MIDRDEIVTLADALGLTPTVVEKDYVLGWLLAGIFAESRLSGTWVFKGGTCLKKCYFETYRFSEDLDFTLRDESHLDEVFLKEAFASVAAWVYENSGQMLPAERLRFDLYENKRGGQSCEGRVYYRSQFLGDNKMPRIKLDLTADEVLVMESVERTIAHDYSDRPANGMTARCYDYTELYAEKVRALGERTRPRDLYDVVNLYRHPELRPVRDRMLGVLQDKCAFKGIPLPTMNDVAAARGELLGAWEQMLGHQLPHLPSFDTFWSAIQEFFIWLAEGEPSGVETSLVPAPALAGGVLYRPAFGHIGLRTAGGQSLEVIRFAGANRLCVDLGYGGSVRRIEPYSFRRTQDGNILLYAVRADSSEIRAYRTDRIESARITDRPFTPRYMIEIGPHTASVPSVRLGHDLSAPRVRTTRRSVQRRTSTSDKPIHVYRCMSCDKTFRRKTQTSKLNPHKDKDGFPCPGRTAIYEDTVW